MSSRTLVVVTGAAFLVAAVGVGWHFLRAAQRAEVSLATLQDKLAALDASVQEAQEKIVVRQREAGVLRERQRTLAQASAAPQPVVPRGRTSDPVRRIAADPKLHELYLDRWQAHVAPKVYGAIYRRLSLSRTQIDRFEALAREHQDELLTMRVAAAAQGIRAGAPLTGDSLTTVGGPGPNMDDGLAELAKQSAETLRAAITRELGAEIAAAVAQEERIQGIQANALAIVATVNGVSGTGSPPLTNTQIDQLMLIMAEASPTYQAGGVARNDLDWDTVYAAVVARLGLSAAQLDVVRSGVEYQKLHGKVRQFYASRKQKKQ